MVVSGASEDRLEIVAAARISELRRLITELACHDDRGGTPSDFPPSMPMAVPVTMVAASLTR